MVRVAALKRPLVSARLETVRRRLVSVKLLVLVRLLVQVQVPIPPLRTVRLARARCLIPVRSPEAKRESHRSPGAGARSRPGLRVAPL